MTLGDGLMLMAVASAAVGAFIVELFQRDRGHPKAWIFGWAAWSGVLMVGVTYCVWRSGSSLLEAALVGLLVGVAGYPLLRAIHWLEYGLPNAQLEEDRANAERMRYRATDFGGTRQAALQPRTAPERQTSAQPPVEIPIITQPADTVLAGLSKPPRKAWERVVEGLIVIGVMLGVAICSIWVHVGDPRAVREAIGFELAAMGYPLARISKYGSGSNCRHRGDVQYRWRAPGAEGRACTDIWGRYGEVWVTRIWRPDGTAIVVKRQ